MANDFSSEPVIFVEQNVDDPLGNRYGRWWSAYWAAGGGNSTVLPLAMVDSGYQIADGSVGGSPVTTANYYNAYRSMVEAALSRPTKGEIEAYSRRIGDKLEFTLWFTNLSGEPLRWGDTKATALVYEDANVQLTERFIREAPEVSFDFVPEIPNGRTVVTTLETADLINVNWNNLHTVLLVDYKYPDPIDHFDILQAALPLPPDFRALPPIMAVFIDPADQNNATVHMDFRGPQHLSWISIASEPWITFSHSSGPLLSPPIVTIDKNQLASGWQYGTISLEATSTDGLIFSRQVPVSVYFGPVYRTWLPLTNYASGTL